MALDPGKLDLDSVLRREEVTVKLEVGQSEHAEERAARLKIEERDSVYNHRKTAVLFGVLLIVLLGVIALCGYEIGLDGTASPETKRWAETALSSLITGTATFLCGKAIGHK